MEHCFLSHLANLSFKLSRFSVICYSLGEILGELLEKNYVFFTRQTKAEFRPSGDLLGVSTNRARAPGPEGTCTAETGTQGAAQLLHLPQQTLRMGASPSQSFKV